MENKKRILCIGAHPDDIEVSMGGTIISLVRSGHEVKILDLTNGEPTPFGSEEIRAGESADAAEKMGISRKTLTFQNRFLWDTLDVRNSIAQEIREFLPHILFIHYPEDAHPDHWAASISARAARFYGKLSKTDLTGKRHYTPRIFYFFSVHLKISPQPDFCFDISNHFERKVETVLCYKSQFQELDSKLKLKNETNSEEMIRKYLETNANFWGLKTGVRYAEPFYSPEIPCYGDFDSLVYS